MNARLRLSIILASWFFLFLGTIILIYSLWPIANVSLQQMLAPTIFTPP